MSEKKKICFVSVMQQSVGFIHDAIRGLADDYDIYLAANITELEKLKELPIKGYRHIDIERKISLGSDLKALRQLYAYFRKMKFDAAHSLMPKAGLISAMAAWLARVPLRLHTYTGQVWATRHGAMRTMLKNMDRLIAKLNTHVLTDGFSQRDFLIKEKVIKAKKSLVLGKGSVCGVRTESFTPNAEIRAVKRAELGITDGQKAFMFLGRLNRDKGIVELLTAYNKLAEEVKDSKLVLFGNDEENMQQMFPSLANLSDNNFLYYGLTREPYNMLQAADIFVLPTYREGFGSSVIEAQCMGLPVITSDAYGVLDASIENVTGLRCKVGDADGLYDAMLYMCQHPEEAEKMGRAGRERVLRDFSVEYLVGEWKNFYNTILPTDK